jgi:hypothetical protein
MDKETERGEADDGNTKQKNRKSMKVDMPNIERIKTKIEETGNN